MAAIAKSTKPKRGGRLFAIRRAPPCPSGGRRFAASVETTSLAAGWRFPCDDSTMSFMEITP